MANRFPLAELVKMRLVARRLDTKVLAHESAQVRASILGSRQHFNTIAGTKNQAFVHSGMLHQAIQRFREARIGDIKALTNLYWSGFVIHPDDLEIHD